MNLAHTVKAASGFHHNYFIMYHGTKKKNVAPILDSGGLRASTGPNQMLGSGVYVSRDIDKTKYYQVCNITKENIVLC